MTRSVPAPWISAIASLIGAANRAACRALSGKRTRRLPRLAAAMMEVHSPRSGRSVRLSHAMAATSAIDPSTPWP